jgi:HK97 family phage prohead protease
MPNAAEAVTRATAGLQRRHLTSRALEVRAEGAGKREVEGIGVPYAEVTELWPGLRESFAPGSVEAEDALLFWRHTDPIGRVLEQENRPEGWWHRSRVSEVPEGDHALTLARDGVVRSFSVGFEPKEWTETRDDDGGITITHTKVRVREVSLVPIPAYESAQLAEVRQRHERTPEAMPPTMTTEEALEDVRAQLGEYGRKLETLAASGAAGGAAQHPALAFRTFGEYVKAAAAGDERALELHKLATRAITTPDVAVPMDSWVANLVELMTARQPVARSFVLRDDLPAEGMGVEFWRIGDDTTAVAEQANEGDDLAYGELTLGSDRAPVRTFGGWSAISRQAIERTPVAMLDTVFSALALKYARAIELAVRAVFTASHTAALAGTANRVTMTAPFGTADAGAWLDLVLDVAELFDDRGRELTGIKVSRDVFRALADVPATDRLLVVRNAPAGTNGGGTLDVSVPEADLYGISIELVPGWTGANAAAYDRMAIRTQEAPGAPLRLQDDNVVNLTRAFSVYGYAATYLQIPGGLVAVNTAGA